MSESNSEKSADSVDSSNHGSNEEETCEKETKSRVFLRPSALQVSQQTSRFGSFGEIAKKPGSSFNLGNPFGGLKSSSENGSNLFGNNSFSDVKSPEKNGGGFVFGQNLRERVTNAVETSAAVNGAAGEDLTFSKAFDKTSEPPVATSKSLEESAQEYESKQVKRTYEEVSVVTGEEGESNVVQLATKLFAFETSTSNWIEKGRGLLRLNDREVAGAVQSRIIMRTNGSLRVVLNAQVWPDMRLERPSEKTIRITVCEADGIKVYLVMANPKDIDVLYNALDWRIAALRTPEKQSTSGATPPNVKKARLDFLAEQRDASESGTEKTEDSDDTSGH